MGELWRGVREWIACRWAAPATVMEAQAALDLLAGQRGLWARERADLAGQRGLWARERADLTQRCEQAERRASCVQMDLTELRADHKSARTELESVRGELADARSELKQAWAECVRTEADNAALMNGLTASGLSAAEVERLALLSLAAGKLAAEAAKVTLYGWGSAAPKSGRPAYTDIERGMGRVQALTAVMADLGDVRQAELRAHATREKDRLADQIARR